jgi:arylformamidase
LNLSARSRHNDPAWLDAQYNNRALIADHAAVFASWRQASALARAASSCRVDVRYGDQAGETLDVFPAPAAAAPVLVFVHGGYWRSLDKADHSFIAPAFVGNGVMVVLPNYALCPAVSVEQIALQTVHAVAWTWRHAALYGGDPGRIVVVGHSAGAHLAAMLLGCDWKSIDPALPQFPVRGALGISGVYDLMPLRHAPFIKDDLKLSDASVRRLSPAYFPRPKRPFYAAVGGQESDEFLRQTRLIRDQWGPTRVPVCESLSKANHLTVLHSLADPRGRLHELALRLLELR